MFGQTLGATDGGILPSQAPYFIGLVSQVAAIVILVNSGALKVVSISTPRHTVETLTRLGAGSAGRLVKALAGVEIVAAVLLAVPAARWLGAALVVLLSCTFGVAAAKAIAGRLDVQCGCFGDLFPRRLGTPSLVLVALVLVTSVVAALPRNGGQDRAAFLATVVAVTVVSIGLAFYRRLYPPIEDVAQ